ncbi:lambda-crystallin homolog isoform X4 [Hylobates moloch]|uniref:lambda-crystallin homolog isoform X4 n=1 Tax=Hylobates moloch TaxID=81572 RepID=UPI0026772F27|nr:lambda-crystallin homolog isoform X4 [Hylobates moloch]
MESSAAGCVVIVGSGVIGRSWAMLFASGGFQVKLYDIEQQQIRNALESIRWASRRAPGGTEVGSSDSPPFGLLSSWDYRKEMKLLEQAGSLKGSLSVEEQLSLISGCPNIQEAVEGAMHIQVNPPYYIPLVELVPHPETAPTTVDRTHALMKKIGQCPMRVQKEVAGFVLNRLQYAIISEAWRLVEEGIVSPSDLDLVMSEGLGMRYAFIGPLETMHLNAEGMLSYCDRYSEGMKHVLKTFGPIPEFSRATAEKVNQDMCMKVPGDPEHLAARRQWRDECLMRLAKLKSQVQPR